MDAADPNNPCRWSPDRGLSLRVHVRKLSDLESHDKAPWISFSSPSG